LAGCDPRIIATREDRPAGEALNAFLIGALGARPTRKMRRNP
jgi:hypothetical protein